MLNKRWKRRYSVNQDKLAWTFVVLSGGRGLRLGRDKALERVNGQRLIERVIGRLLPLEQEIIVVTISERVPLLNSLLCQYAKVKIVTDCLPGGGPLVGIYTGLKAASTFYSLVVACDMPFLNVALLRHLACIAPGFDIVMPTLRGMLEPLHAVYSKNCLNAMGMLMGEGRFQIAKIIPLVKTRFVKDEELEEFDPEHLSFFNINTEADLRRAKVLIGEQNKSAAVSE